jgi:hypothetical protein
MGFGLSAGNQSGAFLAVGPHQHHHSAMRPAQAHQALLAIRIQLILSREEQAIERFHASRQIDVVFGKILSAFGGVMAVHLLYMQ